MAKREFIEEDTGVIKENLIQAVVNFHNETGRTPTNKDLPREFLRAFTYFGGWNNLLLEANLPLNKTIHSHSGLFIRDKAEKEATLIKNLQEVFEYNGGYASIFTYDRCKLELGDANYYSSQSIIKHFGNWRAALQAADLPLKKVKIVPEKEEKPYTPSSRYQEGYERAIEQNFPGEGRGRDYAFRAYHGEKISHMAKEDGVTRQRVHMLIIRYLKGNKAKLTKRTLRSILIDIVKTLKIVPTAQQYTELRKNNPLPSVYYYLKHFGNWKNAIDSAVKKIVGGANV